MKTEKLIGLGLAAFVVYELWKRQQPPQVYAIQTDSTSNIPVWTQQLAAETTSQMTSSTSTVDNLLNIPQGPGGSYVDYYNNGSGPGQLFGTNCILRPVASPGALLPSLQVFS
jgi:hypothetical protein